MATCKDAELLRRRFSDLRERCIKAVLMFGSRARGEHGERSDIDLLVLHDGCGIKNPVKRRSYLYNLLRELIGKDFEDVTLIDMEFDRFLKPTEITSLLLNVYWDAIVLYDRTGLVQSFLKRVRERIVESGLKRAKDGKAYRWSLPKPMAKVKIL